MVDGAARQSGAGGLLLLLAPEQTKAKVEIQRERERESERDLDTVGSTTVTNVLETGAPTLAVVRTSLMYVLKSCLFGERGHQLQKAPEQRGRSSFEKAEPTSPNGGRLTRTRGPRGLPLAHTPSKATREVAPDPTP